jgi:malate synthase
MSRYPDGVEISGRTDGQYREILTPEAVAFVAKLGREFNGRRRELLHRRAERQSRLDMGERPDFLPETRHIREADWTIAPIPVDLQDRRVEITGPTDRKMIINALNSGASVFMADFEDANAPTWSNMVLGQLNLRDAIRRQIDYTSPEGKRYALKDKVAVLMARPRGWHLVEKHVTIDGEHVPGGLFDFGLYYFHNARELLERGTGPYFYLPKMESHLEARLWNDVFQMAQDELGIPRGTIKATVLIETILAAFEEDEILYELRDHSAGLNCGRWDYIFSAIKKFRNRDDIVLADRSLVTMTSPFMRSYSLNTIKTCHRRKAHAMGGMAAQIPVKNDPAANEAAMEKVRQDKLREVTDGHDGTWVAHPALVAIALEEFNRGMPTANQLQCLREDVHITAADLLNCEPQQPITEKGLRWNINVAVQYLGAWLGGTGAVPIFNLMEDAATAEISRGQVWQWIKSPLGVLDDGRKITLGMFRQILGEELGKMQQDADPEVYANSKYPLAAEILDRITCNDIECEGKFSDFLTLPAYEYLD